MSALSHPPTTRRISRDQVLQLGQNAARPWEFLPLAWQVLRITPRDHVLQLLTAANLARLGLRTPALEVLATLDPRKRESREDLDTECRGTPDTECRRTNDLRQQIEALAVACKSLPEDRITHEALAATCCANLEVLTGHDLRSAFGAWRDAAGRDDWFRTLDGNIVRRRAGADGLPGKWTHFADHRSSAERFAARHLMQAPGSGSAPGAEGLAAMYTVEGVDPPWVLMQVAACTQCDGFQPRLNIIQADEIEFLDGLACADLRDVLSQERVRLYTGSDAAARFSADLRACLDTQLSGPYIPLSTLRSSAGAAQLLQQVQAAQVAEHHHLLRQVQELYAPRDAAWWSERYRDAAGRASSPSRPLRVLIPTTRYSTYLQYASADLAETLNRMGLEARLLIEPDSSCRLSSLSYLRQFRDFQPDLVILTNYFRKSLGECIPDQVPLVSWIQDAMPHHFQPQAAQMQGKLDFIAGHLHPEMFTRGGFERSRSAAFPIVVSTVKFHDGPIDRDLRKRCEYEIALVSHHSETPQRMHDRMVREAGDPQVAILLRKLYPHVVAIGEDPLGRGEGDTQWKRLRAATAQTIEQHAGRTPTDEQITPIFRQYALPLAERVLRHQTIRWAVEVADRRGWRLALYGRGWEEVEGLAPYARGPAAHGEELRAIYKCAAVNLHISATALVHQRIMECALSGGLPICRLTRSEIDTVLSASRRRALLALKPDACDIHTRQLGLRAADNAELMATVALMQRLNAGSDASLRHGFCWTNPPRPESLGPDGIMAMERRADWVFGDLAQVSFQSPQQLEQVVERALARPQWRSAMSQWIAGRVRRRLTHEAFMRSVLSLVESSLQESSTCQR